MASRKCKWCGKVFTALNPKKASCSRICMEYVQDVYQLAYRAANKEKIRERALARKSRLLQKESP